MSENLTLIAHAPSARAPAPGGWLDLLESLHSSVHVLRSTNGLQWFVASPDGTVTGASRRALLRKPQTPTILRGMDFATVWRPLRSGPPARGSRVPLPYDWVCEVSTRAGDGNTVLVVSVASPLEGFQRALDELTRVGLLAVSRGFDHAVIDTRTRSALEISMHPISELSLENPSWCYPM